MGGEARSGGVKTRCNPDSHMVHTLQYLFGVDSTGVAGLPRHRVPWDVAHLVSTIRDRLPILCVKHCSGRDSPSGEYAAPESGCGTALRAGLSRLASRDVLLF